MKTILLFLVLSISGYSQTVKNIPKDSENKKLAIENTNLLSDSKIEPDSIQWVKKPCPYEKTKNNRCPVCKKTDKTIPIVYGLIIEITDANPNIIETNGVRIISDTPIIKKKKYKSGGCVVSDCQPSWFCERDDKKF